MYIRGTDAGFVVVFFKIIAVGVFFGRGRGHNKIGPSRQSVSRMKKHRHLKIMCLYNVCAYIIQWHTYVRLE